MTLLQFSIRKGWQKKEIKTEQDFAALRKTSYETYWGSLGGTLRKMRGLSHCETLQNFRSFGS